MICGVGQEGGASCFGDDEYGQLGVGRTLQRMSPGRVSLLRGVRGLWASARNACAIDDKEQLWCWGSNHWRAFHGNPGIHPRPIRLGAGVKDLAMGTRGLYALMRDETGRVHVQAGGKLLQDHGAGPWDEYAYPHSVPDLDEAEQVVAGVRHGCERETEGVVKCWGSNAFGQLGEGSARSRKMPTPVLLSSSVTQIATGGFHTCGMRDSGEVFCWGSNSNGQVGPGPTWTCKTRARIYPCVRKPRQVLGAEGIVSLAAGQWHTCGLTKTGKVVCWGANHRGQLGDGTTIERSEPKPVKGIANVKKLAVGDQHACAVTRSGTVWCWGDDGHGELGRTTKDKCGVWKEPCGLIPAPVEGIEDATEVAAGWEFSCAIREEGTVWCWGNNHRGALGKGEAVDETEPVAVQFSSSIKRFGR